MPNPFFHFKQFSINQDKCAMKVGTDGVLLGAWSSPPENGNILDIGTGTGLIALMLAQKSKANIDAVEIDNDSYMQACENIANSPWKSSIFAHNLCFTEYAQKCTKKYDLIVSNPPYFEKGSKSNNPNRNTARFTDRLPFSILIQLCSNLLNNNGLFSLILPYHISNNFINEAFLNRLYCIKRTNVISKKGKQPLRSLLLFAKKNEIMNESTLIIEADSQGTFTNEYKDLTKDYFLHF
jgi:tRNA1Val (adenine37-N6)-methyltransferase